MITAITAYASWIELHEHIKRELQKHIDGLIQTIPRKWLMCAGGEGTGGVRIVVGDLNDFIGKDNHWYAWCGWADRVKKDTEVWVRILQRGITN